MDQQERGKILTAFHNLELRKFTPEPCFDPYSDMTTEERFQLIMELIRSRKSDQERVDSLMEKVDKLTNGQLAANETSTLLRGQLSELMNLLKDREDACCILQSKSNALVEQLKINRKALYGSKSQKGISPKRIIPPSRRKTKIILTAVWNLFHRWTNNSWETVLKHNLRQPLQKRCVCIVTVLDITP